MKKINKLFDFIGFDGCKHIILSSVLTILCKIFLPLILTFLLVLSMGVAKEIYDIKSNRGYAEWKDLVCNIIGIIIGIL